MDKVSEMGFGYGILGCGWVAPSHAAGVATLKNEGVRLVAVADADVSRAESLGTQFAAHTIYTDYNELLARSDIDAVSVCLPDFMHRDAALAAAAAGKHVLCEKPLALDVESADEMIREFRIKGLQLGLVMNHRYARANIWARRVMQSGAIGRPLLASVVHSSALTGNEDRSSPWRGKRGLATGGILATQAIHFLDLLFWLAGPAVAVKACLSNLASQDLEFEDTAALALRLSSGALATVATTNGAPIYDDAAGTRLEIHGTEGYLILEGDRLRACELRREASGSTVTAVLLPTIEENASMPFGHGHAYEVMDFVHAVRKGVTVPVAGEVGRYLLAVIEAAERSASADDAIGVECRRGAYDLDDHSGLVGGYLID